MNSEAATYIADALTDTYGSPEVVSAHNGLRRKEAADRGQSEPTDEELLLQVGAGSREALGFLFRRHARAVNHIAFRILRDECEADDLRQDVFVYLSERAQLFDAEKGSGSSWIMQVTYHRAIDRRRHLVSRQHYSAEEFDEQRLPNTKAEPLEDAIAGREILDRMREQLTTNQQQTSFTSSKATACARLQRRRGKRLVMLGTTFTGRWSAFALMSFPPKRS